MQEYSVTVTGNPEDPLGNPIPYKRSTQRTQWKLEIILYNQWKDYIRNTIFKVYPDTQYEAGGRFKLQIHPFTTSRQQKAYMSLKIFFKGHSFGDPDNIFKGIADALFKCDKYLAGSFDFEYSNSPRVEIKISFPHPCE